MKTDAHLVSGTAFVYVPLRHFMWNETLITNLRCSTSLYNTYWCYNVSDEVCVVNYCKGRLRYRGVTMLLLCKVTKLLGTVRILA